MLMIITIISVIVATNVITWLVLSSQTNTKNVIDDKDNAQNLMSRDTMIVSQGIRLGEQQVELDDALRLSGLGSLAATVAHELRNPLGVIRTAIYNIRRKNKNPDILSHLDNIDKKIMESDRIINNLLNYARIKTPQFEQVDLLTLLKETIINAGKKYEKHSIQLTSNLDTIKKLFVEADPVQLQEIFGNVLDNAYQSIDSSTGIIIINVAQKGAMLSIDIQDNGIGIEIEDIKAIFKPFFTKKSKGNGLGLTLCLELLHLHHGKIKVHSKPGKGSTFTITLPVSQNDK